MGTIKQNRANNILTSGKIDATDGLNNNIPAANIANSSLSNVTAFPPSAGAGVSQLASDPPSPTEGQMWYNTTTNTLKQYALGAGTWATGTDSPYAATGVNGVGSQTSALIFGGEGPPGAEVTTSVLYNGTTWTTTGSLNTSRQIGMNFGTSTSALSAGGETGPAPTSAAVEIWNGSTWTTSPTTISSARRNGGGSGADSTSGVIFGGGEHPSYSTSTEDWNGSAWTAG